MCFKGHDSLGASLGSRGFGGSSGYDVVTSRRSVIENGTTSGGMLHGTMAGTRQDIFLQARGPHDISDASLQLALQSGIGIPGLDDATQVTSY